MKKTVIAGSLAAMIAAGLLATMPTQGSAAVGAVGAQNHVSKAMNAHPKATARILFESGYVRVPNCEEDEGYLRGAGNFDGARWDRYVCAHLDDIARREELHAAVSERLCESARARRHWARVHGITIMPEACDR